MCRVVLQTLETPFNGLWTQDKDENYVIFCSAASDPKGVGGSAAGLSVGDSSPNGRLGALPHVFASTAVTVIADVLCFTVLSGEVGVLHL